MKKNSIIVIMALLAFGCVAYLNQQYGLRKEIERLAADIDSSWSRQTPLIVGTIPGDALGVRVNPISTNFRFMKPSLIEFIFGRKTCPISVNLTFENHDDAYLSSSIPYFHEGSLPYELSRQVDFSDTILGFSVHERYGTQIVELSCDPLNGSCVSVRPIGRDKETLVWPVNFDDGTALRISEGILKLQEMCGARPNSI
ncbi:MAG: hypothetical protein ABJP89_19590 [Lentilitoribacter sp.]